MEKVEITKPHTWGGWLIVLWGIGGVMWMLIDALWRLTPMAWTPIAKGMMHPAHWGAMVVWVIANGYMEGYRGFQCSFSPMVVERAFSLAREGTWLQILLAPAYCMALFAAERRQMIVSWMIIFIVLLLILLIRQLSQPWRGIVDAGVVVGLGWGALSIVVLWGRALRSGVLYRRRKRRRARVQEEAIG